MLLAARHRHDLVGGHAGFLGARRAHALEQPLPASFGTCLLADTDGIAVHVEFDLAPRQQPEAFADVLRDRDLALGGDAHGNTPTSNTDTGRSSRQATRRAGGRPNGGPSKVRPTWR